MASLSPLANAAFRRLFTAQVIALVGTGLTTVALTLLAYDLARENAGVVLGTALAFKMVAIVAFAAIAVASWPGEATGEFEHAHQADEHTHLHRHGPHHQHEHGRDEGREPHSHPHYHPEVSHLHVFVIDDHHLHWPKP